MSHLIPSHNKIPFHLKKVIEVNDENGVPVSCNVKSVMAQGGGVGNANYSEKKIRNELNAIRKKKWGENDAETLVAHFLKRQKEEADFFFDVDFDDDNRVTRIFWADARSRLAYESFGDVVSFDSTYGTNRYNMKFCPLAGVNQHFSTILFGCGLLAREDIPSFEWLFKTWLKCMNNKPPPAIVTDQCPSISGAIESVFPGTTHRFCLWHILRKLPDKIKSTDLKVIEGLISDTVKYSYTVGEFEEYWKGIVEDYQLGDDLWLANLFDMREQWVPAFLKHKFGAGMSTTQRSESINAFFARFFNSKTGLRSFSNQYDLAVCKMRECEKEQEYRNIVKNVEPFSGLEIERQFLDAYTLNVYYKFQKEVKALTNLSCEVKSNFGENIIYSVSDASQEDDYTFRVYFTRGENKASCVCRMFEFSGIVCRHMLCVFKQEKVNKLPDCYFLERWRKDKHWPHLEKPEVGAAQRLHEFQYSQLYSQLYPSFCNFVELGSKNEQARDTLVAVFRELQNSLHLFGECVADESNVDAQSVGNIPLGCAASDEDGIAVGGVASGNSVEADAEFVPPTRINNPEVVQPRGRPRKSSRFRKYSSPQAGGAKNNGSVAKVKREDKRKGKRKANGASASNAKAKGSKKKKEANGASASDAKAKGSKKKKEADGATASDAKGKVSKKRKKADGASNSENEAEDSSTSEKEADDAKAKCSKKKKENTKGKVSKALASGPGQPSTQIQAHDVFVNEPLSFHSGGNLPFHPGWPTWNVDLNAGQQFSAGEHMEE